MAQAYRTVSGDVWDKIAKEVYGSESYTSFLMANNQEHISYFIFPEGVILKIEDLPEEDESVLPDWRS
jgi:phage tail protein X